MFWEKYRYKVKRDRALNYWNKLSKADKAKAFYFLPRYYRHLANNSWKTSAEAPTYIKDRFWENQY